MPKSCETLALNMFLASGGKIKVSGVGWIHRGRLLRQNFFPFTEIKILLQAEVGLDSSL